jgi:diacylglycerol kinase
MRVLLAFLRGFAHAFRGLGLALKTQRNLRVHALATVGVTALGFHFHLTTGEWCAVFLACGLVWAAELMNTAIELLADRVSREHEEAIRNVKDTAAAAVLAAALAAAVVGLVVFWPHFFGA